MPAPSIPAPTIVTDIVCYAEVRTLRSRFYWTTDTPPSGESDLTVIGDALKAAWDNAYCALMPNIFAFQKVEVKWYGAGGEFFFAESTSAAAPGMISVPEDTSEDGGSESEDIMPLDNALVIQKKTGNRGPQFQGRIFLGGIAESVFWRGQVTDNFITPVKTMAALINTDLTVAGSGYSTVLHARHWNRKANSMHPITRVYAVRGVGSRMDRRPANLMTRL